MDDLSDHMKTHLRLTGHGENCYICGKVINSYAGNPSEWGASHFTRLIKGKVVYSHMICIGEAVDEFVRNQIEKLAEKEI